MSIFYHLIALQNSTSLQSIPPPYTTILSQAADANNNGYISFILLINCTYYNILLVIQDSNSTPECIT